MSNLPPPAPTASEVFLASVPATAWRRGGAAFLGGAAFTALLFLAVGRYLHPPGEASSPAIEDLSQVYLSPPPPPPPNTEDLPMPPDSSFTGFDYAPTDSSVKIAVSPPLFHIDTPAELAPAAHIHIGIFAGVFKPKMRDLDLRNHVYQLGEVDQRPSAIYREKFNVPYEIIKDAKRLRTVLIFVVEPDGSTGQIRVMESSGNPDYDALVADKVKDWTFSPGVKNGHKVRTLMEEAIDGRVGVSDVFHD